MVMVAVVMVMMVGMSNNMSRYVLPPCLRSQCKYSNAADIKCMLLEKRT